METEKPILDDCILFDNSERFVENNSISIDANVISYGIMYVDKMHFHNFFEMEFILDGQGSQNLNGKNYSLHKGIIYLLTTTDMHKYCLVPGDKIKYYGLQFKSDFISDAVMSCIADCEGELIVDVGDDFDFFLVLFQNIDKFAKKTDNISKNLTKTLLESVCLTMLSKSGSKKMETGKSQIHEIITFIQNHYKDNLTVLSLAEHFQLSPNYLGKLFKDETSMPLLQFIKRTRLLMSANLISNSNLNFINIAYEVGFSSVYVFCREFKKFYSVTAKEYRNNQRSNKAKQ